MEALSNRSAIEEHQVKRLRQMLHEVLKTNEFYRTKLSSDGFPEIDSLKKLTQLPFTTKTELVQDQIARPPFGSDLVQQSSIRISIHAGEPGASIPSTKKMIEEMWGAKCYDHPGATEVGAFGFECEARPGGVHVNESEFIAEVIDPESGVAVKEGDKGELVITNLGRIGSPVIRYRSGDLVQPTREPCECGRLFIRLEGGFLGRVDDMVVVRGINVFPSAIENVMREFPEIEEFRIEAMQRRALTELRLTLEPGPECTSTTGRAERVAQKFRESIGLRPQVELVSPGTLPRFELKAKRFFKL